MEYRYQTGDIVVFKAEDDWLSKCIAWLTNSDASHAAMIYSEDSIVECIAPGVVVNPVKVKEGDMVYLMRLDPESDPAPLIKTADAYLKAKTRYDFPGLIILGGLLLYRKIKPSKSVLSISSRIMEAACLALDLFIQHLLNHDSGRAMVCSQFVYQVYYDCGGSYRLLVEQEGSQNGSDSSDSDQFIRLIDMLPEVSCKAASDIQKDRIPQEALKEEDQEELARLLYDALTEAPNDSIDDADGLSPVLTAAEKLLERLKTFMDMLDSDMPIDGLFVTPGDLVYHTKNLKRLQTIELERVAPSK